MARNKATSVEETKEPVTVEAVASNSYPVLPQYKDCSSVVVGGMMVDIVDGKITTSNPAKFKQFIGEV